jgi:hypothetical protein
LENALNIIASFFLHPTSIASCVTPVMQAVKGEKKRGEKKEKEQTMAKKICIRRRSRRGEKNNKKIIQKN